MFAMVGTVKLVDGDYCSEVEHKCLRSWYDKSNKKTVCEEFAPESHCTGDRTHKRYCIDTYEWPNKKGEKPQNKKALSILGKIFQAEMAGIVG